MYNNVLIISNENNIYETIILDSHDDKYEKFLEIDPRELISKNQIIKTKYDLFIDYDRKIVIYQNNIKKINENTKEIFKEWLFNILNIKDFVPNQHLEDTPRRLTDMYLNELFKFATTPPPKITTFENINEDNVLFMKDIEINSLCAHHFMPFFGKCKIAYVPDKKLVGLSKFPRIINYFSAIPGVQEELTINITEYLNKILKPKAIYFSALCTHMCMNIRGAHSSAETFTEKFIGEEKYKKDIFQSLKSY